MSDPLPNGSSSLSSKPTSFTTSNHLRHVESMSTLPSGAGQISKLNAVILGEALASEEDDLIVPSQDFSAQAHVPSPHKYLEMYKSSIEDPAGFWSDIASQFYWKQKWGQPVYSENLDIRKGRIHIEWFKGGITNICYNCLDKNIAAGYGEKIAIYWEGNEPGVGASLTYNQLLQSVCQLANYLKDIGIRKGDAVLIYLPMLMELPIAMLACCSHWRCSLDVCLTYENDTALKKESTKWVEEEILGGRMLFLNIPILVMWNGLMQKIHSSCFIPVEALESPRCTADCGWITGHSYVTYGPLLNGATVVVFEGGHTAGIDYGPPTLILVDKYNNIFKYKVSIFYTAPTLVRSLMREGDEHVTRYSRKSLRVLGSVGEPINPSAWRWFFNLVGESRCPISDTWWQTETGGFMITPLPGAWPQKPGSATFPFFGIQPVIVDEKGVEIEGECSGYLCVKSSWPGAFRTLYGDHERYETTYFSAFPGYYFSGDGCSRDKDGYHWLTGRVDDVINVSGHRIGTAEVESALVSHPQCAEAAVVGVEHEVKGQGIYAFVTLVEGVPYSDDLRKSLIMTVRKQIGAFAAPDKIHWAPSLPKTRSGKIMRRILRKIASRQLDELGDISTLADPGVVDQLIALADS
ncbi:UNVERIFIED_CONTAM: Acetyl-coenzyme A synthetase, chloroplastic/glyoxysomal [Sesamum calycinum]|uniref:acetate--CoA ligase n=1 Tax=Sesamum calycinum TaxID=2727403 RepID=A0AAW2MJX0_9LAMI